MRKHFRSPVVFRWLMPRRYWGFSVSDKRVFLTFDDGPDPEITPWILDFLKKKGIRATFFCVGENVRKYPEIFQRIINEGHAVGNHTMHHNKGIKTNCQTYLNAVEAAAGYIPSKLFRPPYGRMTYRQGATIAKKYKIIMWSWLSYDFDPKVSIPTILESAKSIKAGDILVLHDNARCKERTKELLPELLETLKNSGFQFSEIKC